MNFFRPGAAQTLHARTTEGFPPRAGELPIRMNQDQLQGMRILIVDDEPVNVALLEDMLGFSEFRDFVSTTDPRQVISLCRARRPDLILLDLNMPHLDGFAVMRRLAEEYPGDECLPILVLTADVTLETKRRALSAGATDFLTKPFDQVEVVLRINNLLRTRRQHLLLCNQTQLLEEAVRERTAELEQTLASLRDAQSRMVQQERLGALGSMTAGIAHDFNNVLSLILGYSEMLRRSLAQPGGVGTADMLLGTVITAAQDAAKMFGRLREFYRPADKGQARQTVDLNALVKQAAELTRPRWHGQALGQGATVRLQTDLAADLPAITADAAELREMLTNLIFNAVDALPGGGEITLRTGAGDEEGEVVLEVADTGVGMDEETRRRCLEPFFTTKGQKGTGLGLAMVYGTVQRHGGRIELASQPGRGTTFRFVLPLSPRPVADVPAAVPVPEVQRPWRVLVVDDQPVFVNILRHYLASDLHTVDTAQDGREALERFHARTFDLVITDRAMPHMRGDELAAAIKKLSPHTRVILLTGYDGPGDAQAPEGVVDTLVLKPVTHAALRAIVSRTMAGYEPAPTNKTSGKYPRRRPAADALQKLKL